MSGTSIDGIDAAVASFRRDGDYCVATGAAFLTADWSPGTRRELLSLAAGEPRSAADMARLHREVGRVFGRAALMAMAEWDGPAPTFAVSHGQTVAHLGPAGTLQLGCGAEVAEATGLPPVADLRAADLALGGEGAPILPAADILLRRHPDLCRIILNLGGIANATLLPPAAAGDPTSLVRAFDIGPANALIDTLAASKLPDGALFDRDGQAAASGAVDSEAFSDLAERLRGAVARAGSLHRDDFTGGLLEGWLAEHPRLAAATSDLLATAATATASLIAERINAAVAAWLPELPADGRGFEGLYLAGGGARNIDFRNRLLTMLRMQVAPVCDIPVRLLDELPGEHAGVITVDNREAVDLVALGYRRLRGEPTGLPAVTGARGRALLGAVYLPSSAGMEERP